MKSTLTAIAVMFLFCVNSFAQVQTGGQTTNGPCSPIFNGNNNTVNCNFPPGNRFILMDKAIPAIAILRKLPTSTTVRISIVGGSKEIFSFTDTVMALFKAGLWTVIPGDQTGSLISSETDGTINHGEGVVCRGINGSAAFEAAKHALAVAGHPCRVFPRDTNVPNVDISIGTRIVPED